MTCRNFLYRYRKHSPIGPSFTCFLLLKIIACFYLFLLQEPFLEAPLPSCLKHIIIHFVDLIQRQQVNNCIIHYDFIFTISLVIDL